MVLLTYLDQTSIRSTMDLGFTRWTSVHLKTQIISTALCSKPALGKGKKRAVRDF